MLKIVITLTLLVAASCQYFENSKVLNEMFQLGTLKNSTKTKRFDACVTDEGETGECMPYYLCKDGFAVIDGEGVIDLRFGEEKESCSSYLEQCCVPPDEENMDNDITSRIDQRNGCGWRNPNGLGFRITGNRDQEAEFGEFPWMVAILKLEPIDSYQLATFYIGGGSLIHPSVVLTAAHILDTTALKVRAGEWDTQTEGEQYPHQERDVLEVDVHDEYNKANVYYDAALLFLTSPFELAPNVGLACLAATGGQKDFNAKCYATGWGKDKFGKEGQYQSILKKVDLHLVEHETCQARLRTTRLQKYFQLHSSFLCAGGEDQKDTCKGDGGSPLVCPIPSDSNRYEQVGIVSWGVQCGTEGIPAVYADVTTLGGWVDRRLALRSLDTSLYRY